MGYIEIIVILIVLFFLVAGLTTLALRRRTEIIKEYFLPEETPVEQSILRPEKQPKKQNETTENPRLD